MFDTEFDTEEVIEELTLADIIIESLNNEPSKWTFSASYARHKNGTEIYHNDTWCSITSEGIYFDAEDQKTITTLIKSNLERDRAERQAAAMKKARSRFGY